MNCTVMGQGGQYYHSGTMGTASAVVGQADSRNCNVVGQGQAEQ